MGFLFHIAEVAALLLVAYVVGWSIGFLLHLALRPRASVDAIPAERLATATGEPGPANALVKAPVIVEVEKAPAPVKVVAAALAQPLEAPKPPDPSVAEMPAPAPVPVAPAPPASPKVSAIETLRGLSSTMPLLPAEAPPMPAQATPPSPPPIVEPESAPIPAPEPVALIAGPAIAAEVKAAVAEITAKVAAPQPVMPEPSSPPPVREPEIAAAPPMPASVPGQAWAGKIHGHEAPPLAPAMVTPAAVELAPEPHPEPLAAEAPLGAPRPDVPEIKPLVVEEQAGLEASLLSIVEAYLPPEIKTMPDPIEDMLLTSVAGGLAIDAEAEAALSTPAAAEAATPEPVKAVAAEPEPEPVPPVPEMVAVTPQHEPPYVQAPVEFDESAAMRDIEGGWSRRRTRAMTDASDVGAAVAAAQVAVESVLARNGVSPDRQAGLGKPKGLPGPRDGNRDNLKQINGLGQLDESTLNNLGIYHFEQIAAWSAAEVLWLENHAFARGRIGQESWQQQAGVLASEGAARRAAR